MRHCEKSLTAREAWREVTKQSSAVSLHTFSGFASLAMTAFEIDSKIFFVLSVLSAFFAVKRFSE